MLRCLAKVVPAGSVETPHRLHRPHQPTVSMITNASIILTLILTLTLNPNPNTFGAARTKKCDQCVQCDRSVPHTAGRPVSYGEHRRAVRSLIAPHATGIARLRNRNPPPHARRQLTFTRPLPPVSCSRLVALSGVVSASPPPPCPSLPGTGRLHCTH